MGKVSPISIKYNINAKINLTGMAERPDVIGAIFGQTEGLLGPNLELRELQKIGKIGRIEVNLKEKNGKSEGTVLVPSAMSKSETALVAAAIETIDRVGPSESKIEVVSIKDVRASKRDFIKERAKELLRTIMEAQPDAAELTTELSEDYRVSEISMYGKLPGGPDFETSEEIIIVEGRADVVNLLKYGIRNTIALNGAKVPSTLKKLLKDKKPTLFVDGDRGGELIVKNISKQINLDRVIHAPDGKEVEELTQKEIIMALRGKNDRGREISSSEDHEEEFSVSDPEKLKSIYESLDGNNEAVILDSDYNELERLSVEDLSSKLNDFENASIVVMDGKTNASIIRAGYKQKLDLIVASKKPSRKTAVNVLTVDDF